jgi:hypothetical protein
MVRMMRQGLSSRRRTLHALHAFFNALRPSLLRRVLRFHGRIAVVRAATRSHLMIRQKLCRRTQRRMLLREGRAGEIGRGRVRHDIFVQAAVPQRQRLQRALARYGGLKGEELRDLNC